MTTTTTRPTITTPPTLTTATPAKKARRARRTKKTSPAPAPENLAAPTVLDSTVEFLPGQAKGWNRRESSRRATRAYYAPLAVGAPSTTRQAEVLNTAIIAAPTSEVGLSLGTDVLSRSMVVNDPFTAYENRAVSSASVLIIGDIGVGKSSLVKCNYVARPLVLRNRRVIVFDKKDQGGAGEYTGLATSYGTAPFRFSLDGDGTILNLLDPAITRGGDQHSQLRLLRTIAELAQESQSLDPRQIEALRAALRAAHTRAEGLRRDPVLTDVVKALGMVADDKKYADHSPAALEELHQAGLVLRYVLGGLLEEFGGLFDGETSKGVHLADRLTSFDISQLPGDGPACSMVVALASTWLMGELRDNRGKFTYQVNEEGWDLINGPSGRLFRANLKLGRGLGLCQVTAIHKLADIPEDSPAMSFLAEAQIVHIFRQSRAEDQARCVKSFNLVTSAGESIGNLADGHHLFKLGSRPEVHVRGLRSNYEVNLTNTDEAMTEGGRAA